MGFLHKNVTLTSDAGGFGTANVERCKGYLKQIKCEIGATQVPTAAWDIRIEDSDGFVIYDNDAVTSGQGTSTVVTLHPVIESAIYKAGSLNGTVAVSAPVEGTLNIYGANMGSVKVSNITLLIDDENP